ncbi:hypothetical protein EJ08DRAFT_663322 [Tothia fuscella]|uniref:Uncharacterized protein n=1 Tax=Tothia fuscella TaxID=1048955 RepID=A0A9P4TVY4_9PEZI|nr:hypothetical protein EJ08DRAFT_663322 [Tothia fuscella]
MKYQLNRSINTFMNVSPLTHELFVKLYGEPPTRDEAYTAYIAVYNPQGLSSKQAKALFRVVHTTLIQLLNGTVNPQEVDASMINGLIDSDDLEGTDPASVLKSMEAGLIGLCESVYSKRFAAKQEEVNEYRKEGRELERLLEEMVENDGLEMVQERRYLVKRDMKMLEEALEEYAKLAAEEKQERAHKLA